MEQIPYGYRVMDGRVVIDEEKAEKVRVLFTGYISGLSLQEAARRAGLPDNHSSAGRMLRNRHYLGDDRYPAIIDGTSFDQAEERRQEQVVYRKKGGDRIPGEAPTPLSRFRLDKPKNKFRDPYRQAEYLYSLIESEE